MRLGDKFKAKGDEADEDEHADAMRAAVAKAAALLGDLLPLVAASRRGLFALDPADGLKLVGESDGE